MVALGLGGGGRLISYKIMSQMIMQPLLKLQEFALKMYKPFYFTFCDILSDNLISLFSLKYSELENFVMGMQAF